MCRNENKFGLWTRTIDYRDVINKSTRSLNSRVALWNQEKLGGNPLQRISETALEDSWRKVHAIYFHCKASKTSRSITSVACTWLWIFARSFSIIRSRVSFGLVPVHFYQKFILLRHVCNMKQDFMAMSLKKFKQTFNKVFNKLDCSQSVSLFQRTRWKKRAKHPLQRTSKLKKQARQEKTKCLRCTWQGHYVMHKQRYTLSDSFRQKKPTWRHGKRMAPRTGNTTNRLKLSLSSSRSSSTY